MNTYLAKLFFVFVVGGLTAFGYYLYTKPVPLTKLYKDPDGRFLFYYPEAWEEIPKEDLSRRNEQFVMGVMRMSEPSTACGMIVIPSTGKIDLGNVSQSLDERLPQQFKDFKKGKTDLIALGGERLYYDYAYLHLGKEPVHQIQAIIPKKQNYYTVSCSTLKDRWSHYRRTFISLFNSFEGR